MPIPRSNRIVQLRVGSPYGETESLTIMYHHKTPQINPAPREGGSLEEQFKQFIAAGPWFEGVPEEGVERLAQVAELRVMSAGDHLYTLGQPTVEVYGMFSGRVRVSISSPQGHEFAVVDREAGAWLGEPA
jgi:hypothetical protein